MSHQVVCYAIDAGSAAKGKFAWVSSRDRAVWSSDIKSLAQSICDDIGSGGQVAVGIECVLFVPCPEEPSNLGKARKGECTPETGNKAFTASAGACATMTGLPSLAWVLRQVHAQQPDAKATTRWQEFRDGKAKIYVWEAFVSGSEKASPKSDHGDALLALDSFEQNLKGGSLQSRVTAENPISLAGALILWAGLAEDLRLLHEGCLVLRPMSSHPRDVQHRRAAES